MRFLVNTIIFAALSLVIVPSTSAQISLSDLPAWEGNDRFYNDVISEVKHPSLTLNGFDSGAPGGGFSLKQVLEEVYSSSADSSVKIVYSKIIGLAANNADFHPSPSSRSDIIENTRRMQARAFMALVTYVMKRNGEGDELESLPDNIETPDKAADRLRSALTNTDAWRIVKSWKADGVKWSTVLENMARTLDLYLALENAYCYYGDQGHTPSQQECTGASNDRLLSKAQKKSAFEHFANQIGTLESSKNWGYPAGAIVDRYHGEPGNASLKIQTAVGYAALTHQSVNGTVNAQSHVYRALSANFRTAGTNRMRYWGYQTDDGKRFWAEGPYYLQFALKDVLPFWHAVRINSMLGYHPDFNAPDPFNHERFTEPLDWLADIVTPDGMTPPLDDGNKHPIRVSMLLRWSSTYGDSNLGQKFAWIANKDGFGASNDLLPVEIAIPRVDGNGASPASAIGNTSASQTGEDGEQQIVSRVTDENGKTHYILLNGESGDACGRGEGHEQADQLQLLYYVDDTSYLMDSGYDSGAGTDNSTWNHYYDHNVIRGLHAPEGGLPNPFLAVTKGRMKIDVYNPDHLYLSQFGNVDLLQGKQYLPTAVVQIDGSRAPATLNRDVMVVGGETPYLIDFSWMRHNVNPPYPGDRIFGLSYHGKSNSVDLNNFDSSDSRFISWSNVDDSGSNLYIFPQNIQRRTQHKPSDETFNDIVKESDDAREDFGAPNTQIERVDIKSYNYVQGADVEYFPVATIVQPRNDAPSYAPKRLIKDYSGEYQGWVWKKDGSTYDVFVARAMKSGTGSAVRASLQDAKNQYPSFQVRLPPRQAIRLCSDPREWWRLEHRCQLSG